MSVIPALKANAKPWMEAGLNLLFPPRCPACRVTVDAPHQFCRDCFASLSFIADPQCVLCGFPFEYDLGQGAICGHCMHDAPPYMAARAALKYDEYSAHLITGFKYADHTQHVMLYADLMRRAGAEFLKQVDLIVPVPLHPRRLRERKFNQATLLAYAVGRDDYPVLPDALLRVKHTPQQAGLTRNQRLNNVRGAFRVNHRHAARLRGTRVLLVDDVMTTGATLKACSKILLGAGVRDVYVLTLARTVREI